MSRETTRMMIELQLLRHAHAGDPEAWTRSDDERPLSAKGRRQADRLGGFLVSTGCRADVIVSSPKVRAVETAEIVARALGLTVRIDERLAYGFGLGELATLLAELDVVRPMLVGHDPDFSMLLQTLCSASGAEMKKGALARIDLRPPVSQGDGTLRWLVPPDLLNPS